MGIYQSFSNPISLQKEQLDEKEKKACGCKSGTLGGCQVMLQTKVMANHL